MTKIRIYELAKELGIDNKAVITKATEIGVIGKLSHSSSLEPEEADQIRRSVIRSAVGKETTKRESEVVTTRVDRATGETQAVVEKRSGNVIRRRKATDAPVSADASASPVESALSASLSGTEDSLASSAEEVTSEQSIPVAATSSAAEDQGSADASPELRRKEEPARTGPRVLGRLEKPAAPVAAATAAATSGSGGASSSLEQAALAMSASMSTSQALSGKPAGVLTQDEPRKPAAGPRVLGKIDLPQPRVMPAAAKQDSGRAFTVKPVSDVKDDEGEEGGRPKGAAKRKGRKREIDRFDLVDYEGREPRRASPRSSGRKRDAEADKQAAAEQKVTKASKRVVRIDEMITVGDFARQMSLKAAEVIAKLIQLGVLATINQVIDVETATLIAEEFGFQVERTNFVESEILEDSTPEDSSQVVPRAPVVTVMGHVDHGKTSLLDAIRKTAVAAKEHGGITQHIGAYQVSVGDKGKVTFIDTPGHAAFTSMRARGAKVTDIVVLVVAADDGVMPQTIEAISHAKAAQVPIVVAINKCDKPDSNPDRIRQQLAEHGLAPEDWGGDTMFFRVSALKKEGLRELLEGILLQAEVKELRANPSRRARGTVIESRQDKGRGTVATVLVQNGTLKVGDVFVAGAEYGRIRSMTDDLGQRLEAAGPSTPVEITGFTGVPEAGDDFFAVDSESEAREVSHQRMQKKVAKDLRNASGPISLEEFARRANSEEPAELNIILKADVHGSLEAVRDAIEKLTTPKVKVRVIHSAVGGVTESDIQLAIASKAIIIGFGVRAEVRAQAEAESLGIDIRFYRIIYELLDDVKKAMAGLLDPVRQEIRTGRVEVRETFNVPKMGTVAGCYVLDGTIKRGSFVRLLRDSKVVHEGKMSSLRRFKDDVREVASGYECGVMLENYNDVKPGDQFEVFEVKEIAATLD